ncbi:MAG: DsrE/DsrF/DrsH-like family protein [Anaerolineae bacterium]
MAENKATILVLSGEFDKIFAAFTLASTCAASGMDTTLFFTFWGIKAIQKGNRTGAGFFGKMLGLMNRGGLNRLDPSHFSFGGIGRVLFRKMMTDKKVASLEELRQACIDLGCHFLACKTSMDVMEIKREDLIPEVEKIVGAATAIGNAAESKVQFFI